MSEENTEVVVETPAEGTQDGGEITNPQVETPAYTPNFKYRVGDQEHEFDEDVRGMVTNEKIEKKLRDLYSANAGLPTIKQERDQVRQEFGGLTARLKDIAAYTQKGDFDNAFKQLGIEERAIYEWVQQKIRLSQLPPEQQAIYNQGRQALTEKEQLAKQYQALEQQSQQIAGQHREMELSQTLGGAEVKQFSDKFDELYGSGAFRKRTIELGVLAFRNLGRDISAQEAVQGVMAEYGPLLSRVMAIPANQPQTPQTTVVVQPKQPVIPNIGRPGSSGAAGPKSIKDLKAIAKSLASGG